MARATGAELLRALRAEADREAGIADRLIEAVETVTDPTAAEARAPAAEQRVAEAEQWRTEADAAAEEMAAQLADAQARAEASQQISVTEASCGVRAPGSVPSWRRTPPR